MVKASRLPLLVVALLLNLSLAVGTVNAQDVVDIEGHVLNGTAGEDMPTGLTVTLQVFDSGVVMDTRDVVVDDQGGFLFEGVQGGDTTGYIISTEYGGALYSFESDYPLPPEPVELTIYEGGGSIDDIVTTGYTLIVDRSDAASNVVGVSELVGLTNIGERTFVPDISDASSMDFLRFSLPLSSSGLEVRSDLQGGQLISVPQGFALTTPVLPGIHEIRYTYVTPYEKGKLTYTHSFPYGTDTFRVLLSDGLGRVSSSDMQEVAPLVFQDITYQQLEAHGLEVGSKVTLEFSGISQSSLAQRFRDAVPGGDLTKWALFVTFGLALVALMVYVLMGRGRRLGAGRGVAEDGTQREKIIEAMARLDDRFNRREIGMDEYVNQRGELRDNLLR